MDGCSTPPKTAGRPSRGLLAEVRADLDAVLGRGVVVEADLEAGSYRLEVTTCPARSGEVGFYLLER